MGEKYAEANPGFEIDWRAKKILERARKVNPAFYPVPMQLPIGKPDGEKHFGSIAEGFNHPIDGPSHWTWNSLQRRI